MKNSTEMSDHLITTIVLGNLPAKRSVSIMFSWLMLRSAGACV